MIFEVQGYRKDAIKEYGEKCEWIGCGWDAASCDVHHINYQEQWEIERAIRKAVIDNDMGLFAQLLSKARDMGFPTYNQKTRQLDKDDRVSNLVVLCPNHHRYVHSEDLGMKVLNFIPKRKTSV